MSDCVAFTSERGRGRQKETTIKEVDVYGLVIDFVALGCMGPFFKKDRQGYGSVYSSTG